jgi:hypothetical protein
MTAVVGGALLDASEMTDAMAAFCLDALAKLSRTSSVNVEGLECIAALSAFYAIFQA